MMAEGEAYNRDKHSFSDADYDKVSFHSSNFAAHLVTNTVISKARSEVEEKIHDAMEAAMAAGKREVMFIRKQTRAPLKYEWL